MSPPNNACAQCGAPLALADSVCPRCQTPVPAEFRVAAFSARAEAFAEAEQWAEAARAAEVVVSLPLDPSATKLWLRKRGAWLQRAGDPRLLDGAEAALFACLTLDDSDDLSHQLYIDLLQRRGRLDTARAWYKQRLEKDPEDGVAKRHLAALRLLDDIKMTSPVKLNLPEGKDGFFMNLLRPTAWKLASAAFAILFSGAMLIYGVTKPAPGAVAPVAAAPAGVDTVESITKLASDPSGNLGALLDMASDPTSNVLQILAFGGYLFWPGGVGVDVERALLVGVTLPQRERAAETSIEELARLAESAGAVVAGRLLQARRSLDPATYIGSGKVQLLKDQARELDAGLVIFDDELKPSQQRNLEEALEVKVLDRTQLILDVFATRANTNEGRLQVELAQLSYLLPRLVGSSAALSRLGGGIGTRGPGETKLESDRRRLRDRIAQLSNDIDGVARMRTLHRANRRRQRAKVAALAGYTNAGKSSLFNALTHSEVYVEDRLFATLDPTVRPLPLDKDAPMDLLLVDTVGFVRKLPHALVAAFRATLEEVAEADLVLRVVDCADGEWPQQLESVDEVLAQVYATFLKDRPQPEAWLIFNKTDLLGPTALKALKAQHPEAHFLSALEGQGLDALRKALRERLEKGLESRTFLIPHAALGELSRQFGRLRIRQQRWTAEGLRLEAVVGDGMEALEPYRLGGGKRRKR